MHFLKSPAVHPVDILAGEELSCLCFGPPPKGLRSLTIIVPVQLPPLLARPAPPLPLGTVSSPSAHVVIGNVFVLTSSTSAVFGDCFGGGCWSKPRLSRPFPGPLQTDTKRRSRPSLEVQAVACEARAPSRASALSYGGSRTSVKTERGDRARCHSRPSLPAAPCPGHGLVIQQFFCLRNLFLFLFYFFKKAV